MSLIQSRTRSLVEVNTAGCVDNGKSTLIGRLLYDSGGLPLDRIEQIARLSAESGQESELNLALFTDGLRREREQGITIDVARHFVHRESFDLIISDAPGHFEYTRNAITGMSNSQSTLILVDATKGIVDQNRRHAYLAAFVGVREIAVLVNKMDLVDYSEEHFESIKQEFDALLNKIPDLRVNYIPISALQGENVVIPTSKFNWYAGPTVLQYIEGLANSQQQDTLAPLRFVVQWVDQLRRDTEDYRVLGHVAAGELELGQTLRVEPEGWRAKVAGVFALSGATSRLVAGQVAELHLQANGHQPRRGDLLVHSAEERQLISSGRAQLCWLNPSPLEAGNNYLLQIDSSRVPVTVSRINREISLATFESHAFSGPVKQNSIAEVEIQFDGGFSRPKEVNYDEHFILIDNKTGDTVAAGLIL
jgi:sulfate adenylyltransferase large subunit